MAQAKQTDDFFDRAFEGASIPPDLRRAAERICGAYGIRGICDPMYVANVIAMETGRGNGESQFTERHENGTSQ